MKVYLILAHKSPELLGRLVNALEDGKSTFFIHVDVKTDITEFQRLFEMNGNVEFVLPRLNVIWGGNNVLMAHLNAFRLIQKRMPDFSHIIILSGQDFPIKNNDYINDFLGKHKDASFIESFSLPFKGWGVAGGLDRYQKVHLQFTTLSPLIKRLQAFANRLHRLKIYRKMPLGMKPYGGSDWYILNKKTFDYLLDFITANKTVVPFFKYVLHSNELFLQTVLINATPAITQGLVNDNKRYIDWSKPEGPYPAILKKEDLAAMLTSDKLFARKFDLDIDAEVITMLEQELSK